MDKTLLVDKTIKEGRELLAALDKAKIDVKAALWFYFSESDEWRLIFALPLVDKQGPKSAYRHIQTVLSKLSSTLELSLSDITVMSPEDKLIQLLRTAITCESDVVFNANAINGIFIEKTHIYRIR